MWVKQYLHSKEPLKLESGIVLPQVHIAYYVYGDMHSGKPVIWVCHAFSGSAEVHEWWSGLFGKGKLLDPEVYTIVSANVLGSCYGTTGPEAINPESQEKYGETFPEVSVRDIVKLHIILRKHLGINKVFLGIGGSMGGQQLLQWALEEPQTFHRLALISTNARHSAWGIAFSEVQRWAMELGEEGIKLARAIGMLSFRSPEIFNQTQDGKWPDGRHKAVTYLRYQGQKFEERFSPISYRLLLNAMDNHRVAKSENEIKLLLSALYVPTLVIGISSDLLFPQEEQTFLATHLARAERVIIDSAYGHDGFLVETDILQRQIFNFLNNLKP